LAAYNGVVSFARTIQMKKTIPIFVSFVLFVVGFPSVFFIRFRGYSLFPFHGAKNQTALHSAIPCVALREPCFFIRMCSEHFHAEIAGSAETKSGEQKQDQNNSWLVSFRVLFVRFCG